MSIAKNTSALLMAGLTALVAGLAQAQPKYAIAGVGATSCGQYLKPPTATKDISDINAATWIQGYLSGTNTQRFAFTKQEMKLQPDYQSIIAYVDKYCREHPLATVYEAAIELDLAY